MSLSLSVTDLQDGGTATCTVAGADLAAATTVYAAAAWPLHGLADWFQVGTLTGNGEVTATVAPGYYWWHAASQVGGLPAISPPVSEPASASADSVLNRVKEAIAAKVRSLVFDGARIPPGLITPEQVYVFPALSKDILPLLRLPAVVVSEQGAEQVKQVVNERDDLGWPVLVTILDRVGPNDPAPFPAYYRFREQISRAIRYQRLPGVPEVYTVQVDPQPISAWHQGEYLVYYSSLLFRAWDRDPRGS